MFIGHYAVALAAKRVALRTSLGTLFAATSLADLLWPVFLLFGWEQAHVVPGPNPFLTLWLDSIPISHSLITLIGWGALRSEEHTSELQSRLHLVCRLLL